MRAFWSDPYLWIHLAGLAALPVLLEVCLLGFATGDPIGPTWLELFLVAVAGVLPIAWMQTQRPFYIFSLVALALRPTQLSEDQRRILTLFHNRRSWVRVIAGAVALTIVLRQLYQVSAIASTAVPWLGDSRLVGLLLASGAFLGANLFLQVPLSVLQVMLASEAEFTATAPFVVEQIPQNFTVAGLPVNQIVPPLTAEVVESPVSVTAPTEVTPDLEASTPAVEIPADLEDLWNDESPT